MANTTLDVHSPYDGHKVGEVPVSTAVELEQYLQRAHRLFLDPEKRISVYQRKALLREAISIMRSREEQFVTDSAGEGGKPLIDTRVEFNRALAGIEVAIEWLPRMTGEEIPMNLNPPSMHRLAYTMREPVGVCASVSAFNHPINLIVHQVVPQFAVGCPVIIKPARTTPLSCFNVCRALHDAGVPEEWVQPMVLGHAETEALVTDKRVAFFSFIGSAEVGFDLAAKLAPGVHCALEHGGVAPVILEPDADVNDALPLLAKGGFYHAGQVCVSVQRLYVHDSICRDVAERLASLARELKVGDALSENTEVGPLIEKKEVSRVHEWVEEARRAGAEVLCGGEPIGETCYAPTVLLDPPDEAKVSQHEVFGPVVCVYSYTDRLEAIRRANALPYSFQAAVFTKNIDVALDTLKRLKARAVMVNDHTAFRVDWMPFGGREHSGMGTGGIPYSMLELTHEKLMVIRSPLL
jgi:acyl-CoA reductase-like NAD-dependent aldehyde dehydrogenase